jgi:N-acetylglucosamine kinase-like BadF-type ATPase
LAAIPEYILSIESGGSKTISIILNEDADLLGFGIGGSANEVFAGHEIAVHSIVESVEAALRSASVNPRHITMVTASVLMSRDLLNRAIAASKITAEVHSYEEKEVSLAAAFCSDHGVLASSGTGSFVYGKSVSGKTMVLGGFGSILGDEGSGYEIGLQGLKSVIYSLDGRGNPTSLLEEICKKWELDQRDRTNIQTAWDLAEKVHELYPYRHRGLLARLSLSVAKSAREGDQVSQQIIQNAGVVMAELTAAFLQQFDVGVRPIPISYSGGSWNIGELMLEPFRQRLAELVDTPYVIVPQKLQPVFGPFLLWTKQQGIQWDDRLMRRMKKHNETIITQYGNYLYTHQESGRKIIHT